MLIFQLMVPQSWTKYLMMRRKTDVLLIKEDDAILAIADFAEENSLLVLEEPRVAHLSGIDAHCAICDARKIRASSFKCRYTVADDIIGYRPSRSTCHLLSSVINPHSKVTCTIESDTLSGINIAVCQYSALLSSISHQDSTSVQRKPSN